MSSASPPESAEPNFETLTAEIVVVEVDESEFGIRVEAVEEVRRVSTITRLPFPPPAVLGVLSVRGAVLPVLDLGARLFERPSRRDGRVVIVNDPAGGGDVALLVDRVVDLVSGDLEIGEMRGEMLASLPEGSIEAIVSPNGERWIALLKLGPLLARTTNPDEESR